MPKAITKARPDLAAGAPRTLTPDESELQSDELRRQIAEAAYYRAQQRGFEPGLEQRDWLEAEAEVMTRLGSKL
jgi:hypothetical protein